MALTRRVKDHWFEDGAWSPAQPILHRRGKFTHAGKAGKVQPEELRPDRGLAATTGDQPNIRTRHQIFRSYAADTCARTPS